MMNAIVTALALALAGAPAAEPKPKQSPPPAGTPKDVTLPERKELKLPNGLEVTLVPFGTIPKVDLQLVVRTGNIHESAKQIWLADLTGDLMEEGTTTRPAQQLNEEAARMGGSLEVSVTPEETRVAAQGLGEFTAKLVELVADVARNPLFPAEALPRVKAALGRNLAIMKTTPQMQASEKFYAELYPDHPFGRFFPPEAMLAGYTLEDVRGFYAQNFGAQRSHLYVVGRFDPAVVEQAVTAAFGDWAAGPERKDDVPKMASKRAVHLLDRPGAPQSTVYMGVPAVAPGHPDWLAFTVMNELLGAAFNSRITQNIRENKGYTYSPDSEITAHRRSAHWAEVADVTTSVTGASLKEIFYEIGRLQKEPPSAQELAEIKNYVAGRFMRTFSERARIIDQLRFVDLHDLPDSYLETYVQRVMALTPQDLQKAAQQIKTDQMVMVIVGDKKLVEPQLKPYGGVTAAPKR